MGHELWKVIMLCLSQGYMASMIAKGVPEDMKGKDKIVFGNIHQIYDWHKEWVYLCLCCVYHESDKTFSIFLNFLNFFFLHFLHRFFGKISVI